MTVTANLYSALTVWTSATYTTGTLRTGATPASGNTVNVYRCVTGGSGGTIPTGTSSTPTTFGGGTASWVWLSAITFYGSTADVMFSAAVSGAVASGGLTGTITQPIVWQLWNQNGVSQVTSAAGTSFLTLSGHAFTPTNTLTITTAPGESICDQPSGTTPLTFNAALGASFTLPGTSGLQNYFNITDPNVIFKGLQIKDPNSTSGSTVINLNVGANNFQVRNCIIDGTAQSGGGFIVDTLSCTGVVLANSVFVDRQAANSNLIPFQTNAGTTGRAANCTWIAINPQSTGSAHINNSTSTGTWVFQNCVAINYAHGISGSAALAGASTLSFCATDASTIGTSSTSGSGNLISQTAANMLVSVTADFRAKTPGSSLINAGTADTTDIPTADDFFHTARPQGAAWDIGAHEPAVAVALTTRTLAKSAAATAGTFALQLLPFPPTDPWAPDFTVDFGPNPLPPPTGTAKSSGRGQLTPLFPITAKGQTAAQGRASIALKAIVSARAIATAAGRNAGTFSLPLLGPSLGSSVNPWSSDFSIEFGAVVTIAPTGTAISSGRAITGPVLSLAARGNGLSKSTSRLAYAISARSVGKSAGRSALTQTGAARGTAAAKGRGQALYTPGGGRGLGTARASGQVTTLGAFSIALSARGTAQSSGNVLSIMPGHLIITGSGLGAGTSATLPPSQGALVAARGASKSAGVGRAGIAQPVTAAGSGKAFSTSLAVYQTLPPSRGVAAGHGATTPATLSIAMLSVGQAIANSVALGSYQAPLQSQARGVAASSSQAIWAQPLRASGVASGAGVLDTTASMHLTARGVSASRGRAPLAAKASLSAMAAAAARGSAKIGPTFEFMADSMAASQGMGSDQGFLQLALATLSLAGGVGLTTGRFTTPLAARGTAKASGASFSSRKAGMSTRGTSSSAGKIALATGTVQLSARGAARVSGSLGAATFAPIALTGRGQGTSFGRPQASYRAAAQSLGVGLSSGRIAVTAAVTLQAIGPSRASGRLSTAATVGFQARGKSSARGYLFSTYALAASQGRSASFGTSLLSGYYNVTPDVSGPRLSTLTQLPSFDSMDLGDVDFFSWDWSARASKLNDPIVAASVTATPTGLTIGPVVIVDDIVQVKITSAPLVETFSVRCTVTLRSGRVLHWTAPVAVADF